MSTKTTINSPQNTATHYYLYALAFLFIIVLKMLLGNAEVTAFKWLLVPTVALVQLFTNHSFSFHEAYGYVAQEIYQPFVIEQSCAGLNYFTLAFLMATFSFLHHPKLPRFQHKIGALLAFALSSYVFTMLVNSCRIIVSANLLEVSIHYELLGKPMVHLMVGVCCYFTFLVLYYCTWKYLFFSRTQQVFL